MKIKEIPSKQTLPLRNEILRPGKDISTCIFEGDDAPDTRHFGAIDEAGNIVGVVSVYRNGHPAVHQESAWQIRAMATSIAYRGTGVGSLLLVSAENYARESGGLVIWANARSSAIGFYAKSGYSVISEEFVIDGVGPHYLVIKSLDNQGK
jgi:predicted GNAT family N-acyltransferase